MFDESSVWATEHALVWGLEDVGDGDSSHRRPTCLYDSLGHDTATSKLAQNEVYHEHGNKFA